MTTTLEGQPRSGEDKPQLNETVQTLSQMIKDLEKQLGHMLEINEALEQDLDEEKKKAADIAAEQDKLKATIKQQKEEIAGFEDLRAEVSHLGSERQRLAATIEEFSQQLAESARENIRLDHLAERMRIERDDAVEELQSVEVQFDRAMEIATDLRARLMTLAEERDEVVTQLKALSAKLEMTEQMRDDLRKEVEESRRALEDIRREVADACVVSQRYYYQEEEHK